MEKAVLTIESNVDLKPLNTFGVKAMAKHLVRLRDESELPDILRYASSYNGEVLLLGGGSNMLFLNDWNGLIIKIETKGIEVLDEDDDHVYVKAEAGVVWDDLVSYCVERGYGGLENLTGIPGNVGSSPIQNIGAYGVELKDSFYMLEAVSLRTGEFREFYKNECMFDYRYSVFKGVYKGVYLILSVIFKLNKKPVLNLSYEAVEQEVERINMPLDIRSVSRAILNIRRSKLPDPEIIGNAGSFFKNPVINNTSFNTLLKEHPEIKYFKTDEGYKLAAGWLIENCGLKGYRNGDAGIHDRQALVLVNHGSAKGTEIREVANLVIRTVREKFGIVLEPEVNILT